ncbi:cytosine deaminase [Rhizobium rosettiformans]|uniref:cytosine deaminase n=1 Tax=Rhizobium rosettiformans TaxID=1368430 RepID=UPI0028606388|nr:cytosine deaminase [Rhizobium rosettiformans]MDR7030525.1 cytosine deaminase [Rhizobium rosettiformans]MDR7066610.1 cytosine deaminase [Rhizobium rosettiformans]
MSTAIATLPAAKRFVLANATLPEICVDGVEAPSCEGLISADIVVADGKVEAILKPGEAPSGLPSTDLRNGMVWPTFTDMHTHLDKGHIWDRQPNPSGDFIGALEAVKTDREARWTAEDVKARMDFSLRTAYVHGTSLIRTHLDSLAPQHRISFEVFSEVRDSWAGRVDLQAAALFPFDQITDETFFKDLVEVIVAHKGLLGGVTYLMPGLDEKLDILFRTASEKGLDIDLHVDETQDKETLTLKTIAEAKIRNGFEGSVTVGHCCSLARQDDDLAKHTIDLVAEAGLSVVSLPICNMYLQDRHSGRTPRQRGVTLFHELTAAGVPTAVSSDNTRDPFYAYGDLDPVEVFREAVRIIHLDHPLDTAARVVTRTPADILNRPDHGRIAVGGRADLVLFSARRWSEFLSRPQADRIVMRNGMGIDRSLPDYRELDPLLGV